jgi:hypothetical protein
MLLLSVGNALVSTINSMKLFFIPLHGNVKNLPHQGAVDARSRCAAAPAGSPSPAVC